MPDTPKPRRRASELFQTLSGMKRLSSLNAEPTKKRGWLAPLVYLAHNPLTFAGLFCVNLAGVLWLWVLPVVTRESTLHPYLIVFFVGVLPLSFLAGIVLIPLGIYLRYRRERAKGIGTRWFRPFDFSNREFRNLSMFFVGATGFNVIVGGYFSQATIHYMDSPNFCGTTCHSMTPEYTAYLESSHRNIACTDCHIGSGREAYLHAKLNGLRQVYLTATGTVQRPIPTPLHNLRPAREICETCHWPERLVGPRLRVVDTFAEDSANTHTKTVLGLRVGGGPVTTGIHGAHIATGVHIEYVADSARRVIPWVRATHADGSVVEYAASDWDSAAVGEPRVMDCLDCHTRPSHRFQRPVPALNTALYRGTVDTTLPWIRREGLALLRVEYASHEEAAEAIGRNLLAFYETEYPDIARSRVADIARSADGLSALYTRNVFPSMNVQWDAYPDHSGHAGMSGCFRCHDNQHRSADGTAISMGCTTCHEMLAMNEPEAALLERFGIGR